jgi:2C-methyl-D-erythritol 2,4-cyclodiphosphate synthase
VVGFKSKSRKVNIFAIHQILTSKGWTLNTIFNPQGVHLTVTHANAPKWKEYIKDIKEAIVEVIIKAYNSIRKTLRNTREELLVLFTEQLNKSLIHV